MDAVLVVACSLLGLLVGLGCALLAGRAISGLLYRVKGTDPGVILGASVVLGLAALVAVWIPARRAARSNPLGALSPE